MRIRYALACIVALGMASGARAATEVDVPTAGLSSSAAPLKGYVFEPGTPGPHAAIVMLHGCGGAYASDGRLNARHRMWGELLATQGYVVLMLDSFSPRGIQTLCTQALAQRSLKEADRIGDAYAAQAYLRTRQDVQPERIGVLGWSHGGGVVLDTVTRPPRDLTAHGAARFAAAVAFYPGCSARARHADRFHPDAPLLVLMGEADDWTPAAPCRALADAVAARGEPMELVTYPDTYHDFDNPGLKRLHVRREVPNGVHPGQGVTTAPNPVAREDAKARVTRFFARALGSQATP
ncbi:MAG: dienelactone hydrolase family protein [Rhodocyclaceae bacterium]